MKCKVHTRILRRARTSLSASNPQEMSEKMRRLLVDSKKKSPVGYAECLFGRLVDYDDL